ncbi:tryptophanase [uncultured Mycobacterium sp.]|uniref:tryptophanase n=1 Tax=uncultured Mycobacterium sp. TaxID=171292 RepID=UPI0035CA8908
MTSESDLAWLLADEIVDQVPADDRTAVYIELGIGDDCQAITRLLQLAVREELSLPAGLVSEVASWADIYAGNVDEPSIRDLLSRVQRR